MAQHIGYVVLAKRPELEGNGFDHQPAGSVWADRKPVENHQAYCQASAEADPQKYGHVEYVIGRITLDEEGEHDE